MASLRLREPLLQNNDEIVHRGHPHDFSLDDAIKKLKQGNVSRVELIGCNLDDEKFIKLVGAFEKNGRTLEELNLRGNKIGDHGFRELYHIFHSFKKLKKINLEYNEIEDGCWRQVLQDCSSLKEINLRKNFIGELSLARLAKEQKEQIAPNVAVYRSDQRKQINQKKFAAEVKARKARESLEERLVAEINAESAAWEAEQQKPINTILEVLSQERQESDKELESFLTSCAAALKAEKEKVAVSSNRFATFSPKSSIVSHLPSPKRWQEPDIDPADELEYDCLRSPRS